MADIIDIYYGGASPFFYLGHVAIKEVAERHGATLQFKPVDMAALFGESGAVPLPQRTEMRKRYRLIELQRIAQLRNLPLNINPKYFPVDTTLADCCATAIILKGDKPDPFIEAVSRGVWTDEADMSDEATITERLATNGFDPDPILEAARSTAVQAKRDEWTKQAIAANAVGAPSYVWRGEVFWGQDRIEYLDHALTTGRDPITIPTS